MASAIRPILATATGLMRLASLPMRSGLPAWIERRNGVHRIADWRYTTLPNTGVG